MLTDSFRNSSHLFKLIFSLFIILAGFAVFMVLGVLIAMPVFNVNISNLSNALDPSKPENVNTLKFFQSFYSIGLFVLPPLVIAWFFGGNIAGYLKLNKSSHLISFVLAALIIFISIPAINFLVEINGKINFPDSLAGVEKVMKDLENEANETTGAFLATDNFSTYLINIFIMAIIPAIGEEFLFRGIFQRLFHEWSKNIHFAIWLSAFIFSALHAQFYGLIPRMVLGAMFGYFFYWSNNLWLPISAHFLNNFFGVTVYFLNENIVKEAENLGTGQGTGSVIIISTLLITLLGFMLYRIEKEKRNKLALTETTDKRTENDSKY